MNNSKLADRWIYLDGYYRHCRAREIVSNLDMLVKHHDMTFVVESNDSLLHIEIECHRQCGNVNELNIQSGGPTKIENSICKGYK